MIESAHFFINIPSKSISSSSMTMYMFAERLLKKLKAVWRSTVLKMCFRCQRIWVRICYMHPTREGWWSNCFNNTVFSTTTHTTRTRRRRKRLQVEWSLLSVGCDTRLHKSNLKIHLLSQTGKRGPDVLLTTQRPKRRAAPRQFSALFWISVRWPASSVRKATSCEDYPVNCSESKGRSTAGGRCQMVCKVIYLLTNKKTKRKVVPKSKEGLEPVPDVHKPFADSILTRTTESLQPVEEFKEEVNKKWLWTLRYPPNFNIPVHFNKYGYSILCFWTACWSKESISYMNIFIMQKLAFQGILFGSLAGFQCLATTATLGHLATCGSLEMKCVTPGSGNCNFHRKKLSWSVRNTASQSNLQTSIMHVIIWIKMQDNLKRFLESSCVIFHVHWNAFSGETRAQNRREQRFLEPYF